MCCALVTRDLAYPGHRTAHPTVHAVSPSGVPLLVRKPRGAPASNLQVGSAPFPVAGDGGGPSVGYGGGGANGQIVSRGGNFNVLPPIKDTSSSRGGTFGLSELDDVSLKNELMRAMRESSERGLQILLSNMRAQDRDRDGVLSTDQIRGTLRKYQFDLSDGAQRSLCKKFGQQGDRISMVRYEEMFNYFAKCRLEAKRTPPPKPATGQGQYPGLQPVQQHPRKIYMRNKVLFNDRDEAKLIIDLERQLVDKNVNMADLRGVMITMDRDRNDYLSAKQVETAFDKCGINLTPDVRSRLLLATDRTGAGMHKIDTLIDYLVRIKPEAHSVMLGNNHHPRQPRVGQLPMYQNQPTLTAPWEYENPSQQLETRTDFLPDEGFSEEQQQQYALQQPQKELYEPQQPPPSLPEEPKEPEFDVEKWSRDYKILADAVYNADENQSGYMGAEDVRHIVFTYNSVYNLEISDTTINSALNTANDPNYGEVNLEYFIAVVQDMHFREIQSY